MRLCAVVDGVRERLQNGSMTLNAAAQLQNAFDRQERTRERAARSAPGGTGFGAAAQSQDGSTPGPAQPAERKPAPVLDPSKGSTATTRPVRRAGGAPVPGPQAPSRLRRRRRRRTRLAALLRQ